jgi:hypothetical protein
MIYFGYVYAKIWDQPACVPCVNTLLGSSGGWPTATLNLLIYTGVEVSLYYYMLTAVDV